MRRGEFIRSLMGITGGVTLASTLPGCSMLLNKRVKFAISADIHNDIIYNGVERIDSYLKTIEGIGVDFAVDLGDFCMPKESNLPFLERWNRSPVKRYHVLGNHDMDYGDKKLYQDYVGMDAPYYSFDSSGFHFVVLDPNNLFIDDEYTPYAKGNFYKPSEQRGFIDPKQFAWLKSDLKSSSSPTIIFSHQSLEPGGACKSGDKVRELLAEIKSENGSHNVIAAFSGHDHTDYTQEFEGVHYTQINSMSYSWLGSRYSCEERFSDEINKKFPSLKYTAPYKETLYAIVTIDGNSIKIEGVEGNFIAPTPDELGVEKGVQPLSASISNYQLYSK